MNQTIRIPVEVEAEVADPETFERNGHIVTRQPVRVAVAGGALLLAEVVWRSAKEGNRKDFEEALGQYVEMVLAFRAGIVHIPMTSKEAREVLAQAKS